MPKVSVLMGVYNNEKTVAKSIDSIIAQTFTDWELIICDDGSKDDTCSIVASYVLKDKRICLLRNEKNQGLSYTLNRCIDKAMGEYCARMDGDDICDETRFEKQVKFLDEHQEYGFVSTTMTRFDEQGIYQIPESKESYSPCKRDFVKGSPFCHAPVMIRKSAYDLVNGYRAIRQTLGVEDYDLWFRLYAQNVKGYVMAEPLYSMFDGRDAAKRRTFKRRINEAWVRWQGYKMLKVSIWGRIYVIKPVVLGLIPQWLYKKIR